MISPVAVDVTVVEGTLVKEVRVEEVSDDLEFERWLDKLDATGSSVGYSELYDDNKLYASGRPSVNGKDESPTVSLTVKEVTSGRWVGIGVGAVVVVSDAGTCNILDAAKS